MAKFMKLSGSAHGTAVVSAVEEISDDWECPICQNNSPTCGCRNYTGLETEALAAWKSFDSHKTVMPSEAHYASEGQMTVAIVGGESKVMFARWKYINGKYYKDILSETDQRIIKSLLGRHQINFD